MKPFRWNISKANELGDYLNGNGNLLDQEFVNELIRSSARIMAFSGNSSIYFVGRSPEHYFDFLTGVFLDQKEFENRFNLFQFSARRSTMAELRGDKSYSLRSLKKYMELIGLSPEQIKNRKNKTTFVDIVYMGSTFEILFKILYEWAQELKSDWKAIKNKINVVGLTGREKNSPNTWRWHQQVEWINLINKNNVRNVSLPWFFWREIGNEIPKSTHSFIPERWSQDDVNLSKIDSLTLSGIQIAHQIFKLGSDKEIRKTLRNHLVVQDEMKAAWFKAYVKCL